VATMDSDDDIVAATVGELIPYAVQVRIEDYNPAWPAWYAAEEEAIRTALSALVLRIEHTGSTSVPGLAAKPVIDILLVVPDTTDEPAYVPALEGVGYRLRIREPDRYEHRCLVRRAEDGAPYDVNLHVFPLDFGAVEIERIVAFRDWLRGHESDCAYYERIKRELAQHKWKYMQHYADAKSEVVEAILAQALSGHTTWPGQ
jgi:GrpB-like predicted nucleotidyltransferase (UPF0157 family)